MTFMEAHTDKLVLERFPFLDTPYPLASILIAYLVFIYWIGPRYMKSRKPYELKSFMIGYNIFQVVSCALQLYLFHRSGFSFSYLYNCVKPDPIGSEGHYLTMDATYFTFLLKVCEVVETVVFVLRKKNKQISFLHVYHHTFTITFAWFYVRSGGGGSSNQIQYINGVVHLIMYPYYLIAALGPSYQKAVNKFKKYITLIQLTQFAIFLYYLIGNLINPCEGRTLVLCGLPAMLVLVAFFLNFYIQSYIKKSKKVASKSN